MLQFLHDKDDSDVTKAIALPWVFSKNKPATDDIEINNFWGDG